MAKNEEKVAIVTGASSGIGRASAIRFEKAGIRVGLFDIKEDDAKTVKEEVEKAGEEAFIAEAEVKDTERIEKAINTIVEEFGRLDVVFDNAGINGKIAPIEDMTPDELD